MNNTYSNSGTAEDLVRAFANAACAEMHLKTIFEKTTSDLKHGFYNQDDPNAGLELAQKAQEYRSDLMELAQLRRQLMLAAYALFEDGDKELWCMVKHLAITNMCAWESWLSSDDDDSLLNLAIESNQIFIQYLARFFGVEVTDCASCFADFIKATEGSKLNDVIRGIDDNSSEFDEG